MPSLSTKSLPLPQFGQKFAFGSTDDPQLLQNVSGMARNQRERKCRLSSSIHEVKTAERTTTADQDNLFSP